MGYSDDVVAYLHDVPSDGMAITIFGSIKSIKNIKRGPSRIPISVPNPYHCERERDMEYPTRNRVREYPFPQEVGVRYLKNIKRFTNLIKSSYSCNQELCPMIKERMEFHHSEGHPTPFKSRGRGCCSQEQDRDSQTGILPDLPATRHRTSKVGPSLLDSHSIQTNNTNINNISNEMRHNNKSFNGNDAYLNCCDYNNNGDDGRLDNYNFNNRDSNSDEVRAINCDYNNGTNRSKLDSYNYNNKGNNSDELRNNNNHIIINKASDDNISLKRTLTRSVITPKRNIYKDYVNREVREWFQEVPIYPNPGENSNFDKNNIINELTENIYHLSKETKNLTYDSKIQFYIDDFLKSVHFWYPGPKRDQDIFKNRLIDNLLSRIKDLNDKSLINDNNGNDTIAGLRNSRNRYSLSNSEEIDDEVCDWLSMIKFKKSSEMQISADKKEIKKTVMKRVVPLFKRPINSCNYKLLLKNAIVDVLNDFPIEARCSRNRNINLQRFAEDLANRLLSIKARVESNNKCPNTQRTYQTSNVLVYNNIKNCFENIIQREINKCFLNTRFVHQDNVEIEIVNIIMNYVDNPFLIEEYHVKQEILDVLKSTSNVPEFLASNIAQNIILNVKSALNEANKNDILNMKTTMTRNISVYTSQENCCPMNYPVTSTPKKIKTNSISKLSPEEMEYSEKIGNLIRAWMNTLPEQFNAPDEKDFKDTVIKDLAGEFTDEAKLEQLTSVDENEKEKWLKYLVYKWLHKLDVFDLEEVAPQIEELLKRVKNIPVPVLTKPQHGNRQAMANLQHMESELGWVEYFVPKGKDILEDEISIWMNEQPDIFDTDKNTRNNKIQELAKDLQSKLLNKCPAKEISNDVKQWLNKIVKPDQRKKVGELADNLKDRVINLPQDATLAANRDKKIQQRAEHLEAKKNPCCQHITIKTTDNDTINNDKTMQKFIAKFIEHNYDIDDPMARNAFNHLLKTKLQRLNPPTRKEVYDNFDKSKPNDELSRDKLVRELNYIKDISDWLKNIPIEASYNTVGNRERIDFVTDLARNICEVEEQREDNPEAMDYNMYMASIISQFIVQLPILEEHKNYKNMMFMLDQLVGKIIVQRNRNEKASDSMDTSGVHSENIGDFIEEFIRVNGSEIADDEIKLEAWSIRLLNEIKKMVRENANPTALSKAQVYNRLTNVPLLGDESIKQFDNEFKYIKEISEWLKNLPLLPIDKTDEEERVKMICELTEKMTERDINKLKNPNDSKADAEFANYISKWISDLSLDESHEVIVAVVVQQLLNRIERVKTKPKNPDSDFTKISQTIRSTENNDPKINKKQSSKTIKAGKDKQNKNPASELIDTIEKWSASLPIKSDNEKVIKSIKNDVSKKLFQKVGELNIDPRTLNDDLLYQDILADEVDAVIEKLPQNPEMQNDKEKLRTDLVRNVVNAQKAIKENYAGEFYKQKLEHTIEASIPHPAKARRAFDPRFEIYKSRLADMFILENFDHTNDAVKIKYERRIKDEIDKYYDSVKNKNAIPLTKDEIYNELYSALFKVQIPNESAVEGEVEEIKTRCEIDAWFEQLPLKEADGLTEMLERDKILATLAKRIHEIEKTESKPADKIQKEILKWVVKLPLLPGEEGNAEQFAKKLQETIKLSASKRKCITTEPSSKNKKGKTKVKSKENIKATIDDSQIPGPSNGGKMWESQVEHVKPKKKAAEIIIEIVEAWCNQLPIYATTSQEEEAAKMIRDNLSTKIIIKISELNMNPDTFNDDFTYDDLLDEELDMLLAVIPTCCDFEKNKEARKMQLKDAIKSVKPLFREEKARHQYKQDLNITVTKILGKPQEKTAEKEALFNDLKEEIVENFVQFNYDKDNDEGRQAYKIKVHDAVAKFLANVVENKNESSLDPLMRRNQLLCELAKIPVPGDDGLKEDVEEIRMKNEIAEFFDELSISGTDKDKNKLINQVKSSLAKKLNDLELNGYSEGNENKIKQEIEKSLKKIHKEVKPEIVGNFVNKLKSNEIVRRAPRKIKNKTVTTGGKSCRVAGVDAEITRSKDNSKQKLENDLNSKTCCNYSSTQNTSQNDLPSPSKQDLSGSQTQVECECPITKFPQREEYINERPEDTEEVRCICGGLRKVRRPCFRPLRWCYNEDIMPFCRVPAGFFYYR